MTNLQGRLRALLGGAYGGPSVGFENGEFILYEWTDAPVSMKVLASHRALSSMVVLGEEALASRKDAQERREAQPTAQRKTT